MAFIAGRATIVLALSGFRALQSTATNAANSAGAAAGAAFNGQFSKAVAGVGSQISSLGTKMTAMVTLPVVTGFTAVGKSAFEMAGELQGAEISFTRLFGSAEKAKAYVQDLAKTAAVTPFSVASIVNGTRGFVQLGMSAEQAKRTLIAFGDAASANGASSAQLERGLLGVRQMFQKSKIQAQEMNQVIQGTGIPMWELMARATGKSTAELMKLGSEGKLLTKDVMPKLINQIEKEYGGAMAGQANRLTAAWEYLKESVLLEIANIILENAPKISEWMRRMANTIREFIREAKPSLQALGRTFEQAAIGAERLFKAFNSLDDRTQERIMQVVGAFILMGPALMLAGQAVTLLGVALNPITWIVTLLTVTLGTFFGLIAYGYKKLKDTSVEFRNMQDHIKALWQTVKDKAQPLLQKFINKFVDDLIPRWKKAWQEVKDKWDSVWPVISRFIREELIPAVDRLSAAWEEAWPTIEKVIDFLADKAFQSIVALAVVIGVILVQAIKNLTPVFRGMVWLTENIILNIGKIPKAWQAVKLALEVINQGMLIKIAEFVQNVINLWEILKTFILIKWRGAVEGIQTLWNILKGYTMAAWNWFKDFVQGRVDAIKARIESIRSAVDTVKRIFNEMKQAVIDKFNEIVNAVAGLPGRIANAIGNFSLYASGKAIINSFKEGILDAFNGLIAAATSKLGELRNLFPNSPAKAGPFSGSGWVYSSGLAVSHDFGQGIADGANVPQMNAEAMMSGTKGQINSGGFGEVNSHVTVMIGNEEFKGYVTTVADNRMNERNAATALKLLGRI